MKPLLKILPKTLLVLTLMTVVLVGCFSFGIERYETRKLRSAYAEAAMNALALDAALPFPTAQDQGRFKTHYWEKENSPCVFTTNRPKPSGSGVGANWPSGSEPTCKDFYVSREVNCKPVLVSPNIGGPPLSFVLLAATGAKTQNLAAGRIPPDGQARLAKLGRYRTYFYTPDFVRGGGLSGVSATLLEALQCDDFELFRYQAEVRDPRAMSSRLRAAGYVVGMK